ncbi:hypothetical protein BTO06_12590 [Tenacibaculum sp. SZ-18]|uniref:DUF2459 domain-containing protein n=1 Tax=Tenacibaculum sp. SZ-18 TaxID=754423 RepID=UPI000C2D25ED|nr:DUF2459 domain-containing protein [Tenacibaculum sp. SZ-18]AUC15936.1 hypothetical protein BTO06_12590 [Tenacibaculum sp. SZ-18]
MRFIKKTIQYTYYFLLSIIAYIGVSILLSYITVNKIQEKSSQHIYIDSNGIHLSVIIPKEYLSDKIKKDLQLKIDTKFVRFGWGDVNFYLNTPTWKDFKMKYALGALFCDNPTLIEVNPKKSYNPKWTEVPVNSNQLEKLNNYIFDTFKIKHSSKIRIKQKMYPNSQLFEANGSYSPFKTCNTWVNTGFKRSGLKASFWTLFDFGLLNKYK